MGSPLMLDPHAWGTFSLITRKTVLLAVVNINSCCRIYYDVMQHILSY